MPPFIPQNAPLQKGPNTVRTNVNLLMKGIRSKSRRKAIMTIAKKNNISMQEAMFKQALAISRKQVHKK